GMVAMSADPFNIPIWGAIVLGTIGGIFATICYGTLRHFKIGDPTNAISIHLLPGLFGVLTVPFFNSDALLGSQFLGILALVGLATCISVFVCELHNTPLKSKSKTPKLVITR